MGWLGKSNEEKQAEESARQKAWQQAAKNAKELGFDPSDKDLTFKLIDDDNGHYRFELKDGKNKVAEVDYDKSSGKSTLIKKPEVAEQPKQKQGLLSKMFGGEEKDLQIRTPSSQEDARQMAWNHLSSEAKEIGFKEKQKGLTLTPMSGNKHEYKFQLRDAVGNIIAEAEVNKKTGAIEIEDKQPNNEKPATRARSSGKEVVGTRSEEVGATGQYQLVRSRAVHTIVNGVGFEAGKLELVDHKGKVVFSAEYTCGGLGNGSAPFRDARIADNSEIATLIGGKIKTPALRLSNADMVHSNGKERTGILIHSGGPLSHGCIHISAQDRQQLFAMWDKIPDSMKGDRMLAVNESNPREVAESIEILRQNGINVKGADSRQYLASNHPEKSGRDRS